MCNVGLKLTEVHLYQSILFRYVNHMSSALIQDRFRIHATKVATATDMTNTTVKQLHICQPLTFDDTSQS